MKSLTLHTETILFISVRFRIRNLHCYKEESAFDFNEHEGIQWTNDLRKR